jgi:hypothetical protein
MYPSVNAPFISIIISNMSSEQTFQLMNESVSVQFAVFYENIAKESAIKAVLKCAEMYGFDGNEAIQRLGLISQKANPSSVEPVICEAPLVSEPVQHVPVLQTPEPAVVVKKSKPKTDKKSIVISKPAFPLPYSGEMDEDLCHGLVLNEALFTQCQSFPKDGVYCSKCAKQCSTTENKKPMYGTIQDRQKVGIMEYVDPKNRVPIEYVKVMNKYKVSRDDVIAEAGKHNMTIDPIHFEIADKKKGRPKNPTTRVVENTNEPDLFKDLISSKQDVAPQPTKVAPTKASGNGNAKDAEKQRKLEEKLEEKKQKDAEKQRKLEEKKQKDEEKKQKDEEKKRKTTTEKKPKDAPKKKETAPKKKAMNVAEDTKKENDDNNIAKKSNDPEPEEEEVEADVHNTIIFNYNGKQYHRSIETNNVYSENAETGFSTVVGRYDETTKTVIYSDSKLYDDEESEDEYDEEEDESFSCGQYGEDDEESEVDYDDLIKEFDQLEM